MSGQSDNWGVFWIDGRYRVESVASVLSNADAIGIARASGMEVDDDGFVTRMRALTICQPFAHLIATGAKWVENRVWATKYRGPIGIHAGKSQKFMHEARPADHRDSNDMRFGAMVAVAELVACHELRSLPEDHPVRSHKHTEGPFCFELQRVRRIKPIPMLGKQSLWNWEPPQLEPWEQSQ